MRFKKYPPATKRLCRACGLRHYGPIDAECHVIMRFIDGERLASDEYKRRGPLSDEEIAAKSDAQACLDRAYGALDRGAEN